MNSQDIDLESFCTWLCAHGDEVVGYPGRWFDSPLARWLSERAGQCYGVDRLCYGPTSCEEALWLLPRWAQLFVPSLERASGSPVTGAFALVVLAQVELILFAFRGTHQGASTKGRSVMHETLSPPFSEREGFCQSCPAPEAVISLLEQLGFRLAFQMDAVRYPVWSATPDLPAQFHFRDEQGTEVVFLAGKDTPIEGEHFPPHASRFWIYPGADLAPPQRTEQALASRWVLTWQCPPARQNLSRRV